MTNEMQYGVALAMLRNIVNGTGDDLKYLSQVVARVRAAYNILRSLKIANGGAQYEPDHNLCRQESVATEPATYTIKVRHDIPYGWHIYLNDIETIDHDLTIAMLRAFAQDNIVKRIENDIEAQAVPYPKASNEED